jgi:YebC/PmpR family DNA-binding regulatory protein
MSGHSKWSTIKRKKGAADAKRGKLFTKLIKEIHVAVRMGGGPDPDANPSLRTAIDKAKQNNMPNDNINRAIKKASGEGDGANYEESTYEGYGPGGVAVMVRTLSDNKNRTTAEVRHAFSKYGGDLGKDGCVSYLFDKKGLIVVDKEGADEDALMEAALNAGAEDMTDVESTFEIYTAPNDFETVRDAVKAAGFTLAQAEVSMIPQTTVQLTGKQAGTMLKLMELLEDNDDVQDVYSNFDISEEEMEALS